MGIKQHEEANWFICPVCTRVRLRGDLVRIKAGKGAGHMIKVCQGDPCKKKASNSQFKIGDTSDT